MGRQAAINNPLKTNLHKIRNPLLTYGNLHCTKVSLQTWSSSIKLHCGNDVRIINTQVLCNLLLFNSENIPSKATEQKKKRQKKKGPMFAICRHRVVQFQNLIPHSNSLSLPGGRLAQI